ncbi:MAG TPA: V-type ATP synthase subunit I [Firmicutes bacterium]|nr:V-type ATP synthase subunit I [Bacillota bacterium]
MAVLPMQHIRIYALKQNRKAILELLQRRGAVQITDPKTDSPVFEKMDTATAQHTFEKSAQTAQQALAAILELAPEKGGLLKKLEGRRALTLTQYEQGVQKQEEVLKAASRIVLLKKEITDQRAEITRLQTQLDALMPWYGLDVSMRVKETRSTRVFIGSFPQEWTEEELKQALAQQNPNLDVPVCEIISCQNQQTCVFLMCRKCQGETMENALRALGFSYPANPSKVPPQERREQLQARVKEAEALIRQDEKEILSFASKTDDFRFLSDYFTMRTEKYAVLGQLMQSRHTFVITGFIAEKDAPALKAELEGSYGAFVELFAPGEKEDVPVRLQNGRFSSPVEPVLEGYALPARGEVDPCSVMAIFYYVLFGMMLSDACYGLIMVLGCGIVLHKFRHTMESGMKKSLTMFLYSGISTMFWGVMFGGYFGDAVTVIAQTFFHSDFTLEPVWFNPVNNPMLLLVFSLLLGVIHLFTGLGVQFYQLIKQKKWLDAIYDVVFWYLLVGGLIIYMLSTPLVTSMLTLTFMLPAMVGNVGAILAVIGAVGIIATAGRSSRSIGKRLLKGLYGLYGISSWLSDILSYSRLLALGLATGVIASVFNQMGAMAGGGIVGAIFFLVVFVIGHSLNIAINLMGAYVHTNRLQYVEFFGKFYEGGGQKFSPFSLKTQFFTIKEEH